MAAGRYEFHFHMLKTISYSVAVLVHKILPSLELITQDFFDELYPGPLQTGNVWQPNMIRHCLVTKDLDVVLFGHTVSKLTYLKKQNVYNVRLNV